ncbi:2-C-methyl-D-erythritol 4-phosphate cytidylyltransferase [Gloeobacter kilaueensis]|uniref:2-C-methyl-D-erythritol 4-phosphate cytidylyltransferase n=1 Tax=Gloeobacter kilaueensis (strain ATCC BAA-2537 / CCAP 1431/1 / ULC 316 / JS1) TaxID=1183438 RepID=U5QKP3_GLOK1|nr:2-C-methyl-D-erythritol 4-phosphate cytidylyltransferase [Gloeobacter kilaueensis]AGY58250.1 2-C-methyl-D-erythritol 4-phosphate cytidylyltransferase [Gloeobacter kilaueensis JS1]
MHLLIPAAGSGRRMGEPINKLLLPLLGRPILAWTVLAAEAAPTIEWIGVVGQPKDEEAIRRVLAVLALTTPVQWIEGGATRQQSVYRGLLALPDGAGRVLIHDGARCLASVDLLERCCGALEQSAAIIAAVPVRDTIKEVQPGGIIARTVERERLWAAQTPQGFAVEPLLAAHRWAIDNRIEVTDDAALFELRDRPVQVIPGEQTNLKITAPADLWLAEAILRAQGHQD